MFPYGCKLDASLVSTSDLVCFLGPSRLECVASFHFHAVTLKSRQNCLPQVYISPPLGISPSYRLSCTGCTTQ